MKSGTRKLKYRARTNTKNTYKVLKRGGAAGKELSGNTFTRFGIARYLAHSMIIRDYYISRISADCSKGVVMHFINKGHNGFILQFQCATETKAIKILLNSTNPLEDIDAWKIAYNAALLKEYTNIRRFSASKYVIKAYGYFIFDGSDFVGSGSETYNVTFQPTRTIHEGLTYKVEPIPPKVPVKGASTKPILEPFGGIILEYVNFSLRNIKRHLEEIKGTKDKFYIDLIPNCVFTLIELFYQYLLGISEINASGFVHTDIKVDNLMFELHPKGFTAKIVDLANIKDIEKVSDLTSNSKGGLEKQYHLGAITRLMGVDAKGVDAATVKDLKKKYLERYDLYSLCVTFNAILQELKPDIFNFDEALRKCKETGAKLEKKKKTLADHKAIFELFDSEILKISEIQSHKNAVFTLENISSNSEFKTFILTNCIIKMYPTYKSE